MITAVVLTKNEEKNIVDCLESLSFCDEIVIVDDNSNDRTGEIAKKLGAIVAKHSLNNDFSKQRNYGLSLVKSDWVLFIDSDERVSSVLAKEIMYKISENEYEGFYIKREDNIWGKKIKHGEAGNIWLLRLGKEGSGKWNGSVHEEWKITGKTEKLINPIQHYPHQSLQEFIKEINYYTTLRALELNKKGIKVHWYDIIFYPKLKFLNNFFLKLGFFDGVHGLIFALIMSLHSFLVRGKLWILNQKN